MEMEALTKIGLCRNESKVFLALLEAGAASAGCITKKAKLHRTNVYDALDKLVAQGLVGYIDTEGTRVYKCMHPENLALMLHEKQGALKEVLPALTELYSQGARDAAQVTFSMGWHACEKILFEFYADEEVMILGIPKEPCIAAKNMFIHFLSDLSLKDISSRVVVDENFAYQEPCWLRTQMHILQGLHTPTTTIISAARMLVIQWEKQPLLLHITHRAILQSNKAIFDVLYKNSISYRPKATMS